MCNSFQVEAEMNNIGKTNSSSFFEYLFTAHCEPVINGVLTVGALCTGFSSVNNCEQKQEVLSIEDYFIHPNFDEGTLDKDFALVKLGSRSSITPVAIDDASYSTNYDSGEKLFYFLTPTLNIYILSTYY